MCLFICVVLTYSLYKKTVLVRWHLPEFCELIQQMIESGGAMGSSEFVASWSGAWGAWRTPNLHLALEGRAVLLGTLLLSRQGLYELYQAASDSPCSPPSWGQDAFPCPDPGQSLPTLRSPPCLGCENPASQAEGLSHSSHPSSRSSCSRISPPSKLFVCSLIQASGLLPRISG